MTMTVRTRTASPYQRLTEGIGVQSFCGRDTSHILPTKLTKDRNGTQNENLYYIMTASDGPDTNKRRKRQGGPKLDSFHLASFPPYNWGSGAQPLLGDLWEGRILFVKEEQISHFLAGSGRVSAI